MAARGQLYIYGMQGSDTPMVPLADFQKLEAEHAALKAHLQAQLDELKRRLQEMQKLLFGVKSERFVSTTTITPGQLQLEFEGLTEIVQAHKQLVAAHERAVKVEPSKHQGRLPIPAHLERVEEVLEPAEDTTGLLHIGDEVTETLEYQPGKLWVRRTVRRKYARPTVASGDETAAVIVAPMPEQAFPRLKAGVSLLTYLLISKFTDHLPLYRLRQILARQGVEIPESTLGEWVKVAIERLDLLYRVYQRYFLTASYLQMDETTLRVLEESKKGKAHLGYIWVLYDPIHRLPFYTYLPGRSHHGPKKLLTLFRGVLQSDGYSVYEVLDATLPDITLANCWAHARREFFEAKANDAARSTVALTAIQALYAVEASARDQQLTAEARRTLRQEKSKPVLDELFRYLEAELPKVLPKSAIGGAIAYTLKRRENLARYLDDGRLEIDNNLVENAIRPIAVGRKNYLFAGNHEAAQRNAMMYTFLTACKHHGVDPHQWLEDVLSRIHNQSIQALDEFFPQNWNAEKSKM